MEKIQQSENLWRKKHQNLYINTSEIFGQLQNRTCEELKEPSRNQQWKAYSDIPISSNFRGDRTWRFNHTMLGELDKGLGLSINSPGSYNIG